MVPLSTDRALNQFFTHDIFIFTMVANVVVGDIRCFVSKLYTILSSKKEIQTLSQIIKIVYKRILLLHPLDLVNLQCCWYWGWFATSSGSFNKCSFDKNKQFTLLISLANSANFFGVSMTTSPDNTLRQTRFLMVPPMPSMKLLPWQTSL